MRTPEDAAGWNTTGRARVQLSMGRRPARLSQILNFTGEPIDDFAEASTLLEWGKCRLRRCGALAEGYDGPLGRRACKIGRTWIDGLHWDRVVRRLESRACGMYEHVERFEPIIYGVGDPSITTFLEEGLIAHVRRCHPAVVMRFRKNERGGSAGRLGSAMSMVYLAVFSPVT